MSNLIKYPFVNMNGKEKVMIDPENHKDKFVSLGEEKEDKIPTVSQERVIGELFGDMQEETPIIKLEQLTEVERERAMEEAEVILKDARSQAELLLESAKSEVKLLRENERKKGYHEGYAAGEVEARQTYEKLQMDLEEAKQIHEAEYERMIEEIEPKYVDILISYIHKLTGVLLEDRKDIILYLLSNSIRNLDKASHYIVRVSTEDSPVIDLHRNEIRELIGEEATVEFIEEKSLKHNECIIETDSQMVDCGFQTQLDTLTETLKMFVS